MVTICKKCAGIVRQDGEWRCKDHAANYDYVEGEQKYMRCDRYNVNGGCPKYRDKKPSHDWIWFLIAGIVIFFIILFCI